jgi:predicted DNA-binding protein
MLPYVANRLSKELKMKAYYQSVSAIAELNERLDNLQNVPAARRTALQELIESRIRETADFLEFIQEELDWKDN